MKAAIYARVSTQAQLSGNGLDRQVETCLAYAKAHDLTVQNVHIFRECASGGDLCRPLLWRLMDECRGRNVDAVLVEDMDRWTRGGGQEVKYLSALLDWCGARFVNVRGEQRLNDPDSAEYGLLSDLLSLEAEIKAPLLVRIAELEAKLRAVMKRPRRRFQRVPDGQLRLFGEAA